MTKQFRKEITGNNFLVEFHPNTPTYRIFSMWEKELTGLIKHFYPEIDFEEMVTLKHIIYLIRDFGRRAVPLWETMLGLVDDIKSSCRTIDDAHRVVSNLVDKKIIDLVLVKCEYYEDDSRLVHSDMVRSIDLRDTTFTHAAIAIINDVFDAWTRVEKELDKRKLLTRSYHVKTVRGGDEIDKVLAVNGYDSGAIYLVAANVPTEAIIMDETLHSKETPSRPKDKDLVAQVINKFYPLLDEKQKCYLNHLVLSKSFEKVSVHLLEYEHHLFQKQSDVDIVEQELCDKGILTRDIYRVLDIFNGNFLISPPEKRIEFCNDFESAILAVDLEEKRFEYAEYDKTTATELPIDYFNSSDQK